MDEGAGFVIDYFLPLLKHFGFKEKYIFTGTLFLTKYILEDHFLYARRVMGLSNYYLIYPVKIKHKFFSREPYLKLKSITITDDCKWSSIQLENFITKGIKLISAYKKEFELLKDF